METACKRVNFVTKAQFKREWARAMRFSPPLVATQKEGEVDIAANRLSASYFRCGPCKLQGHDEHDKPQNENRHGHSCVVILAGLDLFERRN
jgi:hypothetical protein